MREAVSTAGTLLVERNRAAPSTITITAVQRLLCTCSMCAIAIYCKSSSAETHAKDPRQRCLANAHP